MSKRIKDGEDFDPTNMESLLVARPLLEMMALQKEQQESPEDFDENVMVPACIPVVIDLNVKFEGGLGQAKENVKNMLLTRGVSTGQTTGETLSLRKTQLSSQYVFAKLSADTIRDLANNMRNGLNAKGEKKSRSQREIYAIWPDFELEGHVHRTVSTVKVDAARRSFMAEGDGIVWAVVDSGIDGGHWHFKRHNNLDLSGIDSAIRHMDFTQDWGDPDSMSESERSAALEAERNAALSDEYGHGSHVAGIIAGEYITDPANGWTGRGSAPRQGASFRNDAFVYYKRRTAEDDVEFAETRRSRLSGMSPKTKLVSFKVLNEFGGGEVSNVIAALAQIQAINEYGRYLRIHGVNLSVGYPFNPEWFACGKSPLCVEVDRLVKSGVVVVVSAGNSGYGTKQTLMTRKVRAGMLMTINDPGNARHAITVGATHSEKPHEYGPSYFSSKGPTGDGRLKPDLLAPGERIISCGAGAQADGKGRPQDQKRLYVDQSGTSMAAPHVSGAIAAFLSIRREFIGQPERVKEIFTQSATDLGRDRNMQGAGVVDLMRAIQSV